MLTKYANYFWGRCQPPPQSPHIKKEPTPSLVFLNQRPMTSSLAHHTAGHQCLCLICDPDGEEQRTERVKEEVDRQLNQVREQVRREVLEEGVSRGWEAGWRLGMKATLDLASAQGIVVPVPATPKELFSLNPDGTN